MVRCKNAFGAPSNDERRPPRLIAKDQNKGPKKVIAKKKRKHGDANVDTTAVVAVVAERAKRGVGVCIGDHLTVA